MEQIMEQINFILEHSEMSPYVWAISIMLVIGTLQLLTAIGGVGLLSAVDNLFPDLPELDMPDIELTPLQAIQAYLHLGKVPVLILLVIFLTLCGLAGLGVQLALYSIFGVFCTNWLLLPLVAAGSLVCVNKAGAVIERIIPNNETYVVDVDSLVGKVGYITLGEARKGRATTARVTDDLDETHKVMVEPMWDNEVFKAGDKVILHEKIEGKSNFFKIIGFN